MVAVPHGVCRWDCTNGKTCLTRLHRQITHKSHRWRWSLQVSTQRSHLAMWGRGNPGGNAPGIDEVGGTGNGKATWKRESTNKILFSANCSFLHLHTAMQLTLWARKQQHDTVTTYIRTCVHMLDTVTVTYDVVTTQDTVTAVTSVHAHSTWAASRARPWGQTLWDH